MTSIPVDVDDYSMNDNIQLSHYECLTTQDNLLIALVCDMADDQETASYIKKCCAEHQSLGADLTCGHVPNVGLPHRSVVSQQTHRAVGQYEIRVEEPSCPQGMTKLFLLMRDERGCTVQLMNKNF